MISASAESLFALERIEKHSQHALANDVTRPYGHYEYVPQNGLYKDLLFEDAAEDFGRAFAGLNRGVRNLNEYAGWSSRYFIGDFAIGSRAGLQGIALPGAGFGVGTMHPGHNNGLHILLGPLLLDNIYAGYGAIYNDINGTYPAFNQWPADDRWAQIVWLTFRVTIALGDSISISLQPMIYWLPENGKAGWGMPGPFFGFFLPQMGPMAAFEATWRKEIGNWKFALFDQFSPFMSQWNIWNIQTNAPFFGDLSPIDRVGRYNVGYGADLTNYDPLLRLGMRNSNWDTLAGFYNIAGFRAYGSHGYNTQSMFYFDRIDLWDENFRDMPLASSIRAGAYLQTGDQFLSTYAGYNFLSIEPYNSLFNWAVVGVRKSLSPGLNTYAQAGYYWQSGSVSGDEGLLASVGFQQRISPRTSHWGEVGRRVFAPVRGGTGVENYIEYRISHNLGLRSSLSGFAGISHRNFNTPVENDYNLKYAGVVLNTQVTPRLSALASASLEKVEVEFADMFWDHWTYRSGLMYSLTENIHSHCFYQYEDFNGSPFNYTEHYIYLGVTKRF